MLDPHRLKFKLRLTGSRWAKPPPGDRFIISSRENQDSFWIEIPISIVKYDNLYKPTIAWDKHLQGVSLVLREP